MSVNARKVGGRLLRPQMLGLVVLVAVAIGLSLRDRQEGDAEGQSKGRDAQRGIEGKHARVDRVVRVEAAGGTPKPVSRPSATAAQPAALLPPLDAPVATILLELEARARSGDVKAACRVAMEKAKCSRTITMAPYEGAPSAIADAHQQDLKSCAGVQKQQTDDAWKYLAQAALGGNIAAMSLFVRDPQLANVPPLDAAEGWLLYRDHAATFLARAVEGGDVMALFYSWFTSATGLSAAHHEAFKKDPYRAVVYGAAALPYLDERRKRMILEVNPRLEAQLTSQDLKRATEETAQIRQRYFASVQRLPATEDDSYLSAADCEK